MSSPPRNLPPVNAIRVFEAAARHQNFTRAAGELNMTQAAVSYQVRLLEDRLGLRLFIREPRQVSLTDEGARLARAAGEAFRLLETAFADTISMSAEVLTITALPTFASNWLVPRLGAFQIAHPRLAVRVETSHRLADLTRENVDIGIRLGSGDWPGVEAHFLFPSRMTVLVPASAIATHGPLNSPRDLLRLRLFGPLEWWREWFIEAGAPDVTLPGRAALEMETQQMEVSAALAAGDAAVMATPFFFSDELSAGRLIRPFDTEIEEGMGLWVAHDRTRRNAPKIRAFVDWVIGQCDAAPGPPSPAHPPFSATASS
jgi:LysR family glycine cleavage system transcriptional activator